MSEKEQDRLVRSARSSHNARTTQYDPIQADRLWYRGQLVRLAAVVFVCIVAIGGVGYYLRSRHLEKTREVARVTALIESTETDIGALLVAGKFEAAEDSLRVATAGGLPANEQQLRDTDIRKAKLAKRAEFLDAAEKAVNRGNLADAKKRLDEAVAMNISGPDNKRSRDLQDKINQAEHQNVIAAGRDLLVQSKAAASREDFDEAMTLLENARSKPSEGTDLNQWERELRETIGGRLLMNGEPENATMQIGGQKPVAVGKISHGLTQGPVDVIVRAPGYLPERLHADVRYPDVVQVKFKLVPEAPGPIWATAILAGHCGQDLVVTRYMKNAKARKWRDAIKSLVRPCDRGASKESKTAATGEELDKLVASAQKKFNERSAQGICALDELGTFVASRPEARAGIMKSCASQISEMLALIELSCSDCVGQGAQPCEGCGGRAKKKEDRPCPDCSGMGHKKHSTCLGTGNIKCKSCDGKGYRDVRANVPSNGALQATATHRETCVTCRGTGLRPCNCQKGEIACSRCKGLGKRPAMGPCLTCNGSGKGPRCASCGGAGRRDEMNPVRRREVEGELAKLWRSSP